MFRSISRFSPMASSFSRLVRFVPKSNPSKIFIGEPVDANVDVGLALYDGKDVHVKRLTGSSILAPGQATEDVESIKTVLSPLAREEVGTIRCIGLNYVSHAKEMNLAIPDLPTVFLKPSTALGNPWPEPCLLPKITQKDNTGDYESELAVIIGKTAKNVSQEDALDYVLGYTTANDVSSRTSQRPVVASTSIIPDPAKLKIKGSLNGNVVQSCGLTDMIFTVPQLISFLSQGTTLPAGTVIITGTPPGVGAAKKPSPQFIKEGDEFRVSLEPHIGTLITQFKNE
uniref:Fumarylacetoacetate hydrolase domain-containing protein 2 like n=1 Tax=Talaromyces marneffei PM1 TaxID=1077442 RepID=A0A093UQ65_TALMA